MNTPKEIFGAFPGVLFLAAALCLGPAGPLGVLPASAEQVLHYRTYHPDTGREDSRFTATVQRSLSGGYHVEWVIREDGRVTQETYTLDEAFRTLRFRVVNVDEETDYLGERRDGALILRGRFRGETVQKSLSLDERPFYYNPKLGLSAFVRSKEKERRFWGFQNNALEVYPMKAVRKGLETILIGGKRIEAVKIQWAVDDYRSMFFKRVYWFRPSDGLYLKQPSYAGTFRELVSEEGAP